MKRLDDIRDPKHKIEPKLLRRIRRPSFRFPTINLSFLKSVFSVPKFIKPPRLIAKRRLAPPLLLIIFLVASIFIVLLLVDQKNNKQADKKPPSRAEELKQIVINDDTKLLVNFTFNLKMTINGQPQAIPANFGKSKDGRFIFNTDTTTGDIHVQSPKKEQYTLNDFFALWGGQFNSKCLLNHCLSGGVGYYEMTVNGQPNNEFEKYILQDGDQIVLTYGTAPSPVVE